MEQLNNVVPQAVYDAEARNQLGQLLARTENLQESVGAVRNDMNRMTESLNSLREQFGKFCNDQTKSQAVNRATTELVRIRQEMEQKFNNYAVVRETMLGVLQATDLALVKKETISRVSEELMLSTPEYWLAPCLVAVAAWIGNDQDLAERAIREAVKRDEAKTALTMALICRRNERQQTCYEWLSIYFAHQDSSNFSENTLLYIDAYANGIFGEDEKGICSGYIDKWLNEVKGNSANMEVNQEMIWKQYCEGFSYEIGEQYPDLKKSVLEYPQIDAYIRRINSVDAIKENFDGIRKTEVDSDTMKEKIDKRLIQLIAQYDIKEEGLKNEEHYYDLVKKMGGNEQGAREIITREKQAKREHTMNLVEQMTNVITTSEDVMPSMKKTAVSFLDGYIKKGFRTYINENKNNFPEIITVNVDGWQGTAQNEGDSIRLCAEYERQMIERRDREISAATNAKPTALLVGGIISAVVALIMIFMAPFFAVLFGAVAVALVILSFTAKKEIQKAVTAIQADYQQKISEGKQTITKVCEQWGSAKYVVSEFESHQPESFSA